MAFTQQKFCDDSVLQLLIDAGADVNEIFGV